MRILSRYILREFLVPLAYCLTGFLAIYVLFDLFASFSRLAKAHLPLGTVVEYFCAYLAPYFHYLAPAALLLATLYTMWNFCRHSEIVAMRASGVSFIAIVKPLLTVAFLMSLFVVWVNEVYVPRRAQWAAQMKNENFERKSVEKADNIVYRNAQGERLWNIDRLEDYSGRHLLRVRVTINRPGGARKLNLVAERADYLDGEWWFTKPKIQHYDTRGQEVATPVPELDALEFRCFPEFRERPNDFIMQNRPWQYNSVRDRFRYVRTHPELTAASRNDCLYDAWAQIMAPWACIIITLFAIPAGIASGRQSVFRGIVGALGMFFAYYGLVIGGMIAAKNGWCPPTVGAITPSVVFLILGLRAFIRQR